MAPHYAAGLGPWPHPQVPPPSLLPIAQEGRLFSPEDALSVDLLHEVVPADHLEQRAVARAMELGALPAAGFATVKRGLRAPCPGDGGCRSGRSIVLSLPTGSTGHATM